MARWLWLAPLVAVVGALLLLWPQHGRLLTWDEVDYVSAAKLGVGGNLLDTDSLSPTQFFRFVEAKRSGRAFSYPAGYAERTDPFLLRHRHPPLIPASMAAFSAVSSERAARAIQLVGAVALIAIVVVAYFTLSPNPSLYGLVPLALALAWVSWHLFGLLQFHGWETVFLCLVGFSLWKWIHTDGSRRWAVAMCVFLALGIVTLETGVVLCLPVSICVAAWVRRMRSPSPRVWLLHYLLPGLAIVVGLVVVAWPGLVLKASAIKAPLYYLAVVQEGGTFASNQGGAGSLVILVPASVVILAVAYLAVRHRDGLSEWGPWAVLGVVYGVPLIRFALGPRFLLPAIVPLFIVSAYAIDRLPGQWRAAVATALVALVALGVFTDVRGNQVDRRDDRLARADLAFLEPRLATTASWMDGGHIYRFYVRSPKIQDVSFTSSFSALLVREGALYRTLTAADLAGRYVGILRQRTGFAQSNAGRDLSSRCPLLVRPTVWLWDCTRLAPPLA